MVVTGSADNTILLVYKTGSVGKVLVEGDTGGSYKTEPLSLPQIQNVRSDHRTCPGGARARGRYVIAHSNRE